MTQEGTPLNKVLRSLFCGAALTGALTCASLAADFTPCADTLHSLGLFEGTGSGYALDRAPTRAEAAVMLVRLLGQEDAARELTYTAPFTDLAAWEQPYIQYLYDNGLTQGTSATSWSPEDMCDARMYAAFLLRSLGYSDTAGDFSYSDAAEAAAQLGVYDLAAVDTELFNRDDAAAASYTALAVSPKGEEGMLLDRLTEQGAVDAAAAAPVKRLFANYESYRTMTAKTAAARTYKTVVQPTAVKRNGETVLTLRAEDATTADTDNRSLLTSGTLTLSAANVADKTLLTAVSLENGLLSTSFGSRSDSEACSARDQMQRLTAFGRVPLAYVSSLSRSNDRWTIKLTSPLYDSLTDTAAFAMPNGNRMQVSNIQTEQTVSFGKIVSQTVSFDCTAGEYTISVSADFAG